MLTHLIIAACTDATHKGQGKYEYQVNLTTAFHLCRAFYLGMIDAERLTGKLERYVLPVRPERQDKRKRKTKTFVTTILCIITMPVMAALYQL